MATILIVEDDEELQHLLEMLLSRRGYDVLLSPNGIDAMYQVTFYKPDLIVLDLMMPMAAGDAVLGMIRSAQSLQKTRVLVVSAHPKGEEIAARMQADGFVAKPIDLSTFVQTVETLLNTPS